MRVGDAGECRTHVVPCAIEAVLQVNGIRRPGEPDQTFHEGA